MKHIHSAPYHPSSNGLAERFVRTFKAAMKASEHPGLSFHQRLMSFLLSYRTTPHATTTNVSPSALFLGRHVRTRLDLLHSDVEERVTTKQAQQKMHHDQHARSRDLCVGQRVLARNFCPGAKWIPGTVVERTGPLSYQVQVAGNRRWNRHLDHLLQSVDTPQASSQEDIEPCLLEPVPSVPELPPNGKNEPSPPSPNGVESELTPEFPEDHPSYGTPSEHDDTTLQASPETPLALTPRYPQRVRRPPDRYQSTF